MSKVFEYCSLMKHLYMFSTLVLQYSHNCFQSESCAVLGDYEKRRGNF